MRRLSDVVAEYDRLEAQVRELDDRNASAIGAWIASGREGPAPDDDTDAKSLTARMVSRANRAARPRGGAVRQSQMILDIADAAALELPPLSAAARDDIVARIGFITGDGNPLDAWGGGRARHPASTQPG